MSATASGPDHLGTSAFRAETPAVGSSTPAVGTPRIPTTTPANASPSSNTLGLSPVIPNPGLTARSSQAAGAVFRDMGNRKSSSSLDVQRPPPVPSTPDFLERYAAEQKAKTTSPKDKKVKDVKGGIGASEDSPIKIALKIVDSLKANPSRELTTTEEDAINTAYKYYRKDFVAELNKLINDQSAGPDQIKIVARIIGAIDLNDDQAKNLLMTLTPQRPNKGDRPFETWAKDLKKTDGGLKLWNQLCLDEAAKAKAPGGLPLIEHPFQKLIFNTRQAEVADIWKRLSNRWERDIPEADLKKLQAFFAKYPRDGKQLLHQMEHQAKEADFYGSENHFIKLIMGKVLIHVPDIKESLSAKDYPLLCGYLERAEAAHKVGMLIDKIVREADSDRIAPLNHKEQALFANYFANCKTIDLILLEKLNNLVGRFKTNQIVRQILACIPAKSIWNSEAATEHLAQLTGKKRGGQDLLHPSKLAEQLVSQSAIKDNLMAYFDFIVRRIHTIIGYIGAAQGGFVLSPLQKEVLKPYMNENALELEEANVNRILAKTPWEPLTEHQKVLLHQFASRPSTAQRAFELLQAATQTNNDRDLQFYLAIADAARQT